MSSGLGHISFRPAVVHRVCEGLEVVLIEVCVAVQGDGGGGMAESGLEGFEGCSGGYRERCGGVSQVVDSNPVGNVDGCTGGQPDLFADVPDPEVAAGRGGEDEFVFVRGEAVD